ncbi:MAG: hypothetical protein R2932_51465 [Caldilineaceae bacterium]
MTAGNANSMTSAKQPSNGQTISVEECVDILQRTVTKLRRDQGISAKEQVSLYVTDAPIIHSTLSEYGNKIKENANLTDIVQVNIKAGNPMPEALPQVECTLGDDEVTVAIQQQAGK